MSSDTCLYNKTVKIKPQSKHKIWEHGYLCVKGGGQWRRLGKNIQEVSIISNGDVNILVLNLGFGLVMFHNLNVLLNLYYVNFFFCLCAIESELVTIVL